MEIKVAFWNLQNLFDTDDDPISNDFDFTPANGWTEETLNAKLDNLALVINAMHGGEGPDLLGVCEVENEAVLQELVDRLDRDDLAIARYRDSPDIRGIDCSLIYSDEKFLFDPLLAESHLVHNRYPTRDIFEVPLRVTENNAELIVYVNHWPSRSQGRYESEPYRITVANHLGNLADQQLRFNRQDFLNLPDTPASLETINARWNRNILVMGDLNDEPFDRSVLQELQASSGLDKLEEDLKASGGRQTPAPQAYFGKEAYFFNCMWPLLGQPDVGTYHFSGSVNTMNLLDQFIVSKGLYYGAQGLRVTRAVDAAGETQQTAAAAPFDPDFMLTDPIPPRAWRRPKRFTFRKGADGNVSNNDGFSDHFPIQMVIETV